MLIDAGSLRWYTGSIKPSTVPKRRLRFHRFLQMSCCIQCSQQISGNAQYLHIHSPSNKRKRRGEGEGCVRERREGEKQTKLFTSYSSTIRLASSGFPAPVSPTKPATFHRLIDRNIPYHALATNIREKQNKKRKQTKNSRIGFGKGKIKGERIMRALKEG